MRAATGGRRSLNAGARPAIHDCLPVVRQAKTIGGVRRLATVP